jgi:uncharacterized membrane protein SirB2
MSYLALKHLHITCVVLSGLGFCLRGAWMLVESPLRQHRLARILPHIVDTLAARQRDEHGLDQWSISVLNGTG